MLAQNVTEDGLSEYERAKREVKEEAQKAQVNIDILHEKLVRLEALAKKVDVAEKGTISLILGRFHVHKGQPKLAAALVLKLVSTKEDY